MNGCMNAFGGMERVDLCEGLAQLKGEHPSLLQKLDGILILTQQIGKDIDVLEKFSALKINVANLKAELDPHSDREEGVLFPMMGQYIGTTSGPIAVMEYEHDQAKSSINDFLEKAEKSGLSLEEIKDLTQLAKNAYHILTEHFSKEENVLFPMAETMLSDNEKKELYRRIQEIN